MASPFPSTHLQPSSTISLNLNFPSLSSSFKGCSSCKKMQISMLSLKPYGVHRRVGSKISCAMNMSAGQSDEAGRRSSVEDIMEKARKLWDSSPEIMEKAKLWDSSRDILKKARNLWYSCPEPVKKFPWGTTLENFIQIALDLVVVVIKYLYLPVMAVVSLSELSYFIRERKLFLIPIPLLAGVAVAEYLANKALQVSPFLKEKAEVPWHLLAMGILFTLIKLPGPYYRYWGRILILQFANGGILRTLWFAYLWYKRPQIGRRQ